MRYASPSRSMASPGHDIDSRGGVEDYRNFATKLWNVRAC